MLNRSLSRSLLTLSSRSQRNFCLSNRIRLPPTVNTTNRKLSTSPQPNGNEESKKEVAKVDYDDYDDYEEPVTRGEKVAAYTRTFMWLSFFAAVTGCAILTARELFPGRMGPQNLFSEAFETLQINDEVRSVTGEGMKAFGRDVGRNEGRRNHVDSRQYKEADGSSRTRIRFHVQGPKGKMRVWAEVSDRMPSAEYVYLICQDMRTGRVHTIVDNRARLEAEMAAGPSPEGRNAISALLGPFGGSSSSSGSK